MALPYNVAENIQEKLYDLNPNLKSKITFGVTAGIHKVVATAPNWEMKGAELKTLSEITEGRRVKFDRSGANFKITIS